MKKVIYVLSLALLINACKKESNPDNGNTGGQTGVPSIKTTSNSDIKGTSVSVVSDLTSDGGLVVTERGICYSSVNTVPTITDSRTSDGTALGQITSSINGLTSKTTYYVRAFATNKNGTGYGSALQFTTTTIFVSGTYLNNSSSIDRLVVSDDQIHRESLDGSFGWIDNGNYEYRDKLISNPSTNFTVQGDWYNYNDGRINLFMVAQQKDASTIVIRCGSGYEDAYKNGGSKTFVKQ